MLDLLRCCCESQSLSLAVSYFLTPQPLSEIHAHLNFSWENSFARSAARARSDQITSHHRPSPSFLSPFLLHSFGGGPSLRQAPFSCPLHPRFFSPHGLTLAAICSCGPGRGRARARACGQAQSIAGSESCTSCGRGSYAAATGLAVCTLCPVGAYAESSGVAFRVCLRHRNNEYCGL